MNNDNETLYRWTKSFGRHGSLTAVLVTTSAKLDEAVGETIRYGEVLGKHSDVIYKISADDFRPLTSDKEFIARCREHGLLDDDEHDPIAKVAKEETKTLETVEEDAAKRPRGLGGAGRGMF